MPDKQELLEKKMAWLYPDRPCICKHKWLPGGRLHGVNMGHDWFRTTTEPECWHHGIEAQEHHKACKERFRKTGDWAEFHVRRPDA